LKPKVQSEEEGKNEQSKLPVKIRKRRRSLSDFIAIKREVLKLGLEGGSAVQKDSYKNEDIKKLVNALKQHYNQVQVGMKIVRNELFKVKLLVERVEKTI